jgi:hypothetical protein
MASNRGTPVGRRVECLVPSDPPPSLLQILRSTCPQVVSCPERYRAQVVCHVVGQPTSDWEWRADAEYAYPASRVKVPLAIAALEAANRLARAEGASAPEHCPLQYQPLFPGEQVEVLDQGEGVIDQGRELTLARLIWRALVASENEPANKLYEFVGHDGMQEWAARHGLPGTRIVHRLSEFRSVEEQRRSPRIVMHTSNGDIVIPERQGRQACEPVVSVGDRIGSGFIDGCGSLRNEPMDFSAKNAFGLRDSISVLRKIDTRGFDLTAAQLNVVRSAMSTPPQDSVDPRYVGPEWSNQKFKPLLAGLSNVASPSVWNVHNKIGQAYGFFSDMAKVEHRPSGRVIYVAASVWCCENGILNADRYEYETVGRDFLAAVGEAAGRTLLKY